jgi:hypothetical protein
MKPVVTVGSDGELVQQNAFKNAVTGGWRLAFQDAESETRRAPGVSSSTRERRSRRPGVISSYHE